MENEISHLEKLKEFAKAVFSVSSRTKQWLDNNQKLLNEFKSYLVLAKGTGITDEELFEMIDKVSGYSVSFNSEMLSEELKKHGGCFDGYTVLESKIILDEVSHLMSIERANLMKEFIKSEMNK